jgi:hypothetical protein
MQLLSDKPRSDGYRSSSSKNSDFEPVTGWETPVHDTDSEDDRQKVIIAANNTLLLDQVFTKYKVRLEQTYSGSGWAYKGQCPFDDHRDSTPSFGYNPDANIFNCFGCHRGGKAVEFISYKEGRPKINVARDILHTYGVAEGTADIVGFDFERMKRILFNYADHVLSFKKTHGYSKAALDYAKAVNWSIDVYLRKNSNVTNIDLSSLEARLDKLREQLDLFEEGL